MRMGSFLNVSTLESSLLITLMAITRTVAAAGLLGAMAIQNRYGADPQTHNRNC